VDRKTWSRVHRLVVVAVEVRFLERSVAVLLVVSVGEHFSLSHGQDESQRGENQGVEDSDDGQNVGPADATISDVVGTGGATHGHYALVVPTDGVHDTSEEHTQTGKNLDPSADEIDD